MLNPMLRTLALRAQPRPGTAVGNRPARALVASMVLEARGGSPGEGAFMP